MLLIVVTSLAYHNSLAAPFMFDDRGNVIENMEIRRLLPLWDVMWSEVLTGVAGRPVVQYSFALNYAAGGLHVAGYHLVNLLLHLGTTLLLFGILRRTLQSPCLAARFGPASDALASAASLAWAVHPILTNSVTYVSSRTELLAGFFLMLTLYASLRAMRDDGSRARRVGFTIAAVLACVIGTGCKEIMAAAPILVVLYDGVFVAGSFREAFRTRALLHGALFVTVFILTPFNLYMGNFHRSALVTSMDLGIWDYLKIQVGILSRYVRLSFWPDELAIDYQGWAVRQSLADVWLAGLCIVLLLAATAYGLVRRRSPVAYALAWGFVILAPTSSVLPLPTEVGTERRMYLPLMGLAALGVVGGYRLVSRSAARLGPGGGRAARALGVGIIAVLVAAEVNRTLQRNEDYNNPIGLWADTARMQPHNARAWDNLAQEFLAQDNFDAARECFLKSDAISPGQTKTLNNLGNLYLRAGNEPKAVEYFRAAIDADPDAASPLANLATLLRSRGEWAEAERLARESIRLQPGRAGSHVVLAGVLSARGDFAGAEHASRAALAIDPSSAGALDALGVALAGPGNGRDAEAAAAFREAARLSPGLEPRLHLAWLLASSSDPSVRHPKQAIELASQASEASGRSDPYALDTLALAFAADGRFADAVETAGRALASAKATRPARTGPIERRIKAYSAKEMPAGEWLGFGQ